VRARNGISYLTARRFSAQNRLGALQALKRLKASATDRETGLAVAEIVLVWMLLAGNPEGWTVTNIAAGHSGGNSFGARLAAAVAERLTLNYLQVWHDRPIRGTSHPKEFRRLPPLDMVAKPIGATLIVDDVATSGYHMEEAIKALHSLCIPAAGIAWISTDSATIGRPDWRNGRRSTETQASEPQTVQAWAVGQSWRTKQGADRRNQRGASSYEGGD
jgi:hypoxanthine phosphoribosyltransferase